MSKLDCGPGGVMYRRNSPFGDQLITYLLRSLLNTGTASPAPLAAF